jgi:hypothetical protein
MPFPGAHTKGDRFDNVRVYLSPFSKTVSAFYTISKSSVFTQSISSLLSAKKYTTHGQQVDDALYCDMLYNYIPLCSIAACLDVADD